MSDPTCPKCGGPMWDNRPKIAATGKRMPEWTCKAGKWNPATKQTDGCDGVIWPKDDAALAMAPNQEGDLAPTGAPPAFDWKTIPTAIMARAASIAADVEAGGGSIKPAQALAAAFHFQQTGEVIGRHSYVGTKGDIAGKVIEGYRAIARNLDMSRYQVRYRPLTEEEKQWHEIQPGWQAVICELDVLAARRQCIDMQIPYQPITGIGILKPGDKLTANGKPKDPPKTKTWYWVLCKQAYKDALRRAGENVSAEEVLDETEANGVTVDVPEGARLTQDQAEQMVREVMARAAAQPASTPVITNLGQPADFDGFGDEEPVESEARDVTEPLPPSPAASTPEAKPTPFAKPAQITAEQRAALSALVEKLYEKSQMVEYQRWLKANYGGVAKHADLTFEQATRLLAQLRAEVAKMTPPVAAEG